MSLLEMDFDLEEVTVRGDNGGIATIEIAADEAKELAEFFMQIHDELLKGVKDDTDSRSGSRNYGQGHEDGPYNGDRCSLMGSGNEEAATDDKQLNLFDGLPKVDQGNK